MKLSAFLPLTVRSLPALTSLTPPTSLQMISSNKATTSSSSTNAAAQPTYVPPKVWTWKDEADPAHAFGSINRPTAGARHEKQLPKGKHDLQLYSFATPNGQKVTIMLEELLEAGIEHADYDAWPIKIMEHDQFGSGFVQINPNSKIPALMDYSPSASSSSKDNNASPIRIFESGSILLYLAEKFDSAFLPNDKRTEVMNWLFWQVGSAPYLGGGFGHFFTYADTKMQYPIDRFTMEVKRQLDVLNRQLADNQYIAGDEYTIADIAIYPWYGGLVLGQEYDGAVTFLNVEQDYPHVMRWAKEIAARPAVQRGRLVNKTWGDDGQLPERHSAEDFDAVLSPMIQHKPQ